MTAEAQVFLSLGANLGNREQNLKQALIELAASGISIVRESSVYETAPQDFKEQPWFLNMAADCRTALPPLDLLAVIQNVERTLGRDRTRSAINKGPRLIDIDILLYNDAVIDSPGLVVPHPRMMQRRFVLAPLSEIAPALRHPITGVLLCDQLDKLQVQLVRKIAINLE
jgi:2-amino-4-hydroxy-6-hydroxymethyldihydropteridine diphosphokinase